MRCQAPTDARRWAFAHFARNLSPAPSAHGSRPLDDASTFALLALAAFAAGAMNAVAGGGTLLTFPPLFAVIGATAANATSTVALLPGSFAGAWGYRGELGDARPLAWRLLPASVVGGVLGAFLLIWFPDQFRQLVPWLILVTAVLFAAQQPLKRLFVPRPAAGAVPLPPTPRFLAVAVGLQFLVAVYGGYFGAGIGILMLTLLGLLGLANVHQANAVKTLLASAINAVSVVVFVADGLVVWRYALVMAVASVIGGYAGARVGRRVPARVLRVVIAAIAFGLAGYFFYHAA